MFEKSILVTGGAGFIGANFVSHFAKSYPHYRIIDLDALTYAAHPAVFELQAQMDNVVPVRGNICDAALIRQLYVSTPLPVSSTLPLKVMLTTQSQIR